MFSSAGFDLEALLVGSRAGASGAPGVPKWLVTTQRFVCKVYQLVKRRGKNGLVR